MLQRTAKSTLSARVPTTNAAFRAASPPSLAKLWPGLDRRRRLEARVVREPLAISGLRRSQPEYRDSTPHRALES